MELRKNAGLSQEEMADLLDVSRQSISKWENDKAYPEMTRLLFMSDYFKVSLDYLMRGTEEMAEQSTEQTTEKTAGVAEDGANTEPKPTYQSINLFNEWLSFLSNLSDKQKIVFVMTCIFIMVVLFLIVAVVLYRVGYGFGEFLYRITG